MLEAKKEFWKSGVRAGRPKNADEKLREHNTAIRGKLCARGAVSQIEARESHQDRRKRSHKTKGSSSDPLTSIHPPSYSASPCSPSAQTSPPALSYFSSLFPPFFPSHGNRGSIAHVDTTITRSGRKWALGMILLTLFPRVARKTLHSIVSSIPKMQQPSVRAFREGPAKSVNLNSMGARWRRFLQGTKAKAAMVAAVASLALGVSLSPPGTFQRYHTVGEIPGRVFRAQTVLVGKVVRVMDGDTLRIRHTPLFPLLNNHPGSGRLSEETLIIRLAGIDAPELGKGKKQGQAGAEEAKSFVTKKVLDQSVRIKLLGRDQYARAIASVAYGPVASFPFPLPSFLNKDLSTDLVKEGFAVIYRQKGAHYDGKLGTLERYEAWAKAKRKGVWHGRDVELPHQFKARMKKAAAEKTLAPKGG